MSAPVDVLAVMDKAVASARNRVQTSRNLFNCSARHAELDAAIEARAAVAGLVSAAKELHEARESGRMHIPVRCWTALGAALARVGGAA